MNFLREHAQFLAILVCLALWPIAGALSGRHVEAMNVVMADTPTATIRLPDGSRAIISKGSIVRYRNDLPARRTIWLFGAGELIIVPGPEFTVWTETALVKTAGAQFSVTALGRASTRLSVSEGSATLRALNEDDDPAYPSVVVAAGQHALAERTVGARLLRVSDGQSDRSATMGSTRVARRAGK
jgi:ferric-dicitrate binding protein FerR (iron transport regulator)